MTDIPKHQPGEVLWLLLFGPMHAEFIHARSDITSIRVETSGYPPVKCEYRVQFNYVFPDKRWMHVAVPMGQRTPTLQELDDMVAGIVATRPINPTQV